MTDEVANKEPKKASNKKDAVAIKNAIELNPTLNEKAGSTAVIGWGRMNPITVGHEKLANKIKDVAKNNNATPIIFLTHSQDPKKNPLSYANKIALAKTAFGRNVVQKSTAKTIIQAMQEIDSKYDNIILVVGQDRIKEFETLLNKYNGKDYTFDSIQIVSAGDRDPDAEGIEGMSASKMRAAVADGDKDAFISGLPKSLQRQGERVFDMVRDGMGISEEVELDEDRAPLTMTQRRNLAMTMRRNKSKIAAGRRRSRNRKPTPEKLKLRANKRARDIIRKKVIGKAGVSYDMLPVAQKAIIDKKVAKRKAAIKRLATKLLPKIRAEEVDYVIDELFVEMIESTKVTQDRDVKDMDGTQPSKYYAGVKKSEKDDRARHFAKGAKMDDDNPDAYKPAPGDADAKTKESIHTKKYRDMFGEASQNDVKPKKRFHMLMNKNNTPKIDKRFKAFRTAIAPQTYTEEFDNDEQVLQLVDQIWESVQLEESKTQTALQKKADKSGMPYGVLKSVYDRGVAAWRTGHRPGTTPAQWGMARVNSFVTKGKGTWGKADADLAAKVRKEEVELDEVSASTLRSYVDKARADKSRQQKARTVAKNDYKKYGIPSDKERADAAHSKASQRNTGISMAKRKLGGYTKGTQPKVLAREEVELDEMFSKVHPTLKKELGIHGDHAVGMAGSDKGVAIQFDRPKNTSELMKQMSKHGYKNVTAVGNQKNTYHFNEEAELDESRIKAVGGDRAAKVGKATDPSERRVPKRGTKAYDEWMKKNAERRKAELAKQRNEEVELESFFDLNEAFDLAEASILDKAIAAIHKHVTAGTELGDIAFKVSRAAGVNMTGRELERKYVEKYGQPSTSKASNPTAVSRLKKKYGFSEEGGAGDQGTDKLAKKYKKDTPGQSMNEEFEELMESECQLIGMKQIKEFEKVVDGLFKKFGIDFNFTKHFGDRMSDGRNDPCITLKELADFIKKIYAKQGKSLKGIAGAEAVIKDMQTDLNIPVAVTYDSRNDEFDVVMKTIMRKKNFKSPDQVIKY